MNNKTSKPLMGLNTFQQNFKQEALTGKSDSRAGPSTHAEGCDVISLSGSSHMK